MRADAAAADDAEVRDVDSDETHLKPTTTTGADEDDVGRFDATAAFSSRSRRLHLVQGPPGCGKTKFVAATLRALVERPTFPEKRKRKRSFRVLLCAPSNKAVTVALERFLATIATIGPEASRRPFPLLVGVEEALELACAKDEGDENENENEGSETTTTSRRRARAATRNHVMGFSYIAGVASWRTGWRRVPRGFSRPTYLTRRGSTFKRRALGASRDARDAGGTRTPRPRFPPPTAFARN